MGPIAIPPPGFAPSAIRGAFMLVFISAAACGGPSHTNAPTAAADKSRTDAGAVDAAHARRLFSDALAARAEGKLAHARELFLAARTAAPPFGDALYEAGMTASAMGDETLARATFERALADLVVETGSPVTVDVVPPKMAGFQPMDHMMTWHGDRVLFVSHTGHAVVASTRSERRVDFQARNPLTGLALGGVPSMGAAIVHTPVAFSKDGAFVAFSADAEKSDSSWFVFVVDIDRAVTRAFDAISVHGAGAFHFRERDRTFVWLAGAIDDRRREISVRSMTLDAGAVRTLARFDSPRDPLFAEGRVLAESDDERRMIAGESDRLVLIDPATAEPIATLDAETDGDHKPELSPNGDWLVFAAPESEKHLRLFLYDVVGRRVAATIEDADCMGDRVVFEPGSNYFAFGDRERSPECAQVWSTSPAKRVAKIHIGRGEIVTGLAQDGRELRTARVGQFEIDVEEAHAYDVRTGAKIAPKAKAPHGPAADTQDGPSVVARDGSIEIVRPSVEDTKLVVHELPSRRVRCELQVGDADRGHILDARTFLATSYENVEVFDLVSCKRVWRSVPQPREVEALAFSPSGDAIIASDRQETRRWSLTTAQPPAVVSGGAQRPRLPAAADRRATAHGLRPAALSPDGTYVAGCSPGLRLVHVDSGAVSISSEKACESATFSADGREIVTAGAGGLAIWDRQRGVATAHFRTALPAQVAAFSTDGRFVAAGGAGGYVSVFARGEEEPRITLYAPSKDSAIAERRGKIELLGATAIAREHARCRFGARTYPLALCAPRVVTTSVFSSWRTP